MALAQSDHLVEHIPPVAPNPVLRTTIFPWTAKVGPLRLDPGSPYGVNHLHIATGAAVEDQVTGRRIARKRLAKLQNDRGAVRVSVTFD